MARELPSVPSLRHYDARKIRLVEQNPSVASPRPSQEDRTGAKHVAVCEHEPVRIVRVCPSLRSDEPDVARP